MELTWKARKKRLVMKMLEQGAYTPQSAVFQRVDKGLERLTANELDSLWSILITINKEG